jgi:hypothetical protein
VLHFDASSAECLVLTFKEGLLSAIAHDLEIRVERFDLDVDEAGLSVVACFDAASLRVVGAVRDGAVQPDVLGEADKQKIRQSIQNEVLETRSFSEVRYTSTSVTREGDGVRIAGELTLHGKTRPLSIVAQPKGDRMVAEADIHQPSFGIKPYSAMLGTLKVKPDLRVRCSVPREMLALPKR